ncbi:MAG: hypothetical protein OXB86_04405 [Bdellovibrionales bacterium]|nr:hypothetical protein [Bdellovibrionales bacterium]
MILPSSNITSEQLQKWFEASGYVKRLFCPPQVPSPPTKLEEESNQTKDTDKKSHE